MRAEALPVGVPVPVLRTLGWTVSVLLITAALLPLTPQLLPPPSALTLEVSGAFVRVDAAAVGAAAQPLLSGPLQDLDLSALKRSVEAVPWVAQARIERMWPGTVRITVWEHLPVAQWGSSELLSAEGVVFDPGNSRPSGLPMLEGPQGQQQRVRDAFEGLRMALGDSFLAPQRLRLDARGDWTAWTNDAIELRLGRQSPMASVAMLAGPVSKALYPRRQEVAYVDLHYINGFAVGWRDGSSDSGAERGTRATNDE